MLLWHMWQCETCGGYNEDKDKECQFCGSSR